MEGLIFPLIMLAVTLVGWRHFAFSAKGIQSQSIPLMKKPLPCRRHSSLSMSKDVRDKYLYTKDGLVLTFLRIHFDQY